MTREEVRREIEGLFGFIPTFLAKIPDEELPHEWELLKRTEFAETRIPGKYKHLMGVAISGTLGCPYCSVWHTEAARMHGATDEEIEEAARIAKLTSGWSAYVHGLQLDLDQFRDEVRRMMEHLRTEEEESRLAA